MPSDPLEGFQNYPPKTQMALLAQEMRAQRALLVTVLDRQFWILTSFVALLVTIIGGLSLLILIGGKP